MSKVPDRRLKPGEREFLEGQALWSVEETAAWLGVSQHYVRQGIRDGLIPCLRIGNWFRVRRDKLMEALEAGGLPIGQTEPKPVADLVYLP